MIRFSCHSDNFGRSPAKESFAFIQQLGYQCVDVSTRGAAPIARIMADPIGFGSEIKAVAEDTPIILSELFAGAVEVDGKGINPTTPGADQNADLFRNFETMCRFAKQAGFLSIMGSIGSAQSDIPFEKSFENSAKVLEKQCEIAGEYDLAMRVEPSRTSIIREPENALRFIERVPKLRYTMDFLHYHINGIGLDRSMPLLKVSEHMHIRQARYQIGKCRFEDGGIDYDAIVREMKKLNWQGDICSEFWGDDNLLSQGIYPIEQNIVMRYHFQTLAKKYGLI